MSFLKKCLIIEIVALVFNATICFSNSIFSQTEASAIMQILSDAFFVPGVLIALFGVLLIIADGGGLDGIGYALGTLGRALIPFYKGRRETYSEYKARKHPEGKEKSSKWHLFIVGIINIVISIIFLLIYYQV